MPADDLPYDALNQQYELESASVSPINRLFFKWLARIPTPAPFDKLFRSIKENHSEEYMERVQLLLKTLMDELRRVTVLAEKMYAGMTQEEMATRAEAVRDLLIDGARKAEATRSRERIRRIGRILAGTIAMNLTDHDVQYLQELVRIMGSVVAATGRIDRHSAHTIWENGSWGQRIDPTLDSVFSKLESYGLVSRVAPPNNLNRYVLLNKGLAFTEMIKSTKEWSA
jgi:hypothetical protein